MSPRNEQILNAAMDLFMRYGIGRTTMADIAQAAGVARQTLYNAYPNKDEVLRGVVQRSARNSLNDVTTGWQTAPDLGAKLDIYFKHVPIAWFDIVAAAPDAAEIIDGLHVVAKTETDEAMAELQTALQTLFSEVGADDPNDLADFFLSASKSAKIDAIDRETLIRRLTTLKRATLALLPATA